MTNLIITVCAVVSNAIVSTAQMRLIPVYERVKTHDDPECIPCHHSNLLVLAGCSCSWETVLTHYVIAPKKEEVK